MTIAVELSLDSIKSGYSHFVKSDISDFFSNISKPVIHETISSHISDMEFIELFNNAINVELKNLDALRENKHLFPLHEIGVAQGCCLSPLLGNIYLNDFDATMNGRGIVCIRYIDDFIILGSSPRNVKAAFNNAKKQLADKDLSCYDPFTEQVEDKASYGETSKGFEFLGCHIQPGLISPSKKTKRRILSKVKKILSEGKGHLPQSVENKKRRHSLIRVLDDVSNTLMGWGNQYSFCNNIGMFKQLDREVDMMIDDYIQRFRSISSKYSDEPLNRRRLLGVHVLVDSKYDPIIK